MKSTLRYCLAAIAILCIQNIATAQQKAETAGERCAALKKKSWSALAKVTVADPAEDAYDIRYIKLDLVIPNTSTSISGIVTTRAVVVVPVMTEYVFELRPEMTVDSVRINGVSRPFTIGTNTRKAALQIALPQGSVFTAEVTYHGYTVGNFAGLRNVAVPGSSNRITYTLSEPYESRDWWPCKQSLTDKIDTADIWLTVPANCKGGSNGLLKTVTTMPSGMQRYQWQSRYPIDYYLLSLSVTPYNDYTYYTHFSPSDSMPVQNYIYTSWTLTPTLKAGLDSTGLFIQYLSEKFGRYPFWQEKYGHCLAPVGGGMEHQTMTTLGYIESYLVVHELGHQWWGDDVTCGSWHDIWLNEGFATYTEYIYASHFKSQAAADARMLSLHNDVMSSPGGAVYVDDTTDETKLFSGRLSYNKGSAVLHSLRFDAGSDSLFFAMLSGYRQQHHFGTALTTDLRAVASQYYGRNMDTFFNQWIYGEGFPTISAEWNQKNDTVYLRLRQVTSKPTSVQFFSTPLEVRLYTPTGDTTIRLQFSNTEQDYRFAYAPSMNNLSIDPNNWIINGTGTISRNGNLAVADFISASIRVAPNPTKKSWVLNGIPKNCMLELYDLGGKLLWNGNNDQQRQVEINGAALPSGMYLLSGKTSGGENFQLKLIRE